MKKLKSVKVDKKNLEDLVGEVQSSKTAQILPCTNEWELIRARIEGNLIVVYSSGKISYQSAPFIDALLSKYGASEDATKRRETGEKRQFKPIKTKLDNEQKQYLIEQLGKINERINLFNNTTWRVKIKLSSLMGLKLQSILQGQFIHPMGIQNSKKPL